MAIDILQQFQIETYSWHNMTEAHVEWRLVLRPASVAIAGATDQHDLAGETFAHVKASL